MCPRCSLKTFHGHLLGRSGKLLATTVPLDTWRLGMFRHQGMTFLPNAKQQKLRPTSPLLGCWLGLPVIHWEEARVPSHESCPHPDRACGTEGSGRSDEPGGSPQPTGPAPARPARRRPGQLRARGRARGPRGDILRAICCDHRCACFS